MSRQNWHFRKKIRQVVQKYNFNQLLSNAFCSILIINQKILGAMVINMDLESTIVTINNLLKLDFESSFSDFIQSQKQLMAIPDYQREYKWEKSKINQFDIFLLLLIHKLHGFFGET